MGARLLPAAPISNLDAYVSAGGGRGLDAARRLGPAAITEHLLAAGLRGRGGAGWVDGVEVIAFEGPHEYLYGEETALLEAIDGRPPFPRVAPPYRHGVEEVEEEDDTGKIVEFVMASPGGESVAPPTLVDNVE